MKTHLIWTSTTKATACGMWLHWHKSEKASTRVSKDARDVTCQRCLDNYFDAKRRGKNVVLQSQDAKEGT